MKTIWTYRFAFRLGDDDYLVEMPVGLTTITTRLLRRGTELARDFTDVMQPDGQRNHHLRCRLDDGHELDVEAGYIDWLRAAIAVRLDGVLVYESRPGREIRFPVQAGRDPEAFARQQADFARERAEQSAAWARNKYSIFVDLSIGALFFVLVKMTDDLPLSAVITAGAGLAVVVAQRFVKVDLLGGLALFGIVMLLISAGFSWFFDDDWAVKMKSTILGLLVATITLADAIFRQGRYFGARLMRYMMQPMHPQRLAGGLGVLGLVMAGVNWVFAEFTSQDTWLYYTSFGDFLLSVALMLVVMNYARVRP
jgi:intracellular septation protein A